MDLPDIPYKNYERIPYKGPLPDNLTAEQQEAAEAEAEEAAEEADRPFIVQNAIESAAAVELAQNALNKETEQNLEKMKQGLFELASGLELGTQNKPSPFKTKTSPFENLSDQFFKEPSIKGLTIFELLFIIISIILFGIFGAMISGSIKSSNDTVDSSTKITGMVLISILSFLIFMYVILNYNQQIGTGLDNTIINPTHQYKDWVTGIIIFIIFFFGCNIYFFFYIITNLYFRNMSFAISH